MTIGTTEITTTTSAKIGREEIGPGAVEEEGSMMMKIGMVTVDTVKRAGSGIEAGAGGEGMTRGTTTTFGTKVEAGVEVGGTTRVTMTTGKLGDTGMRNLAVDPGKNTTDVDLWMIALTMMRATRFTLSMAGADLMGRSWVPPLPEWPQECRDSRLL